MRAMRWNTMLRTYIFQVIIAIVLAGCATEAISPQPATLRGSPPGKEGKDAAPSLYYDFKDVPIPKELDIVNEKSFAFQTADSTIGLISFSGGLKAEFLISFFTARMPDDGWRLLTSFRSPKTVLFFSKEDNFCIITIVRRTFGTEVEILRTPSPSDSAHKK
jgi:hypothetical protein